MDAVQVAGHMLCRWEGPMLSGQLPCRSTHSAATPHAAAAAAVVSPPPGAAPHAAAPTSCSGMTAVRLWVRAAGGLALQPCSSPGPRAHPQPSLVCLMQGCSVCFRELPNKHWGFPTSDCNTVLKVQQSMELSVTAVSCMQRTSDALTNLPRSSLQAADWCLSCPTVTRISPQLQVQEAAPGGRGWSVLRQNFKRHAAAGLQAAATHGQQPASRAEATIAPILLKSFARARVRVALKARFADDPVQRSSEKQLAVCSVQPAAVPAEGSALPKGASQEPGSEGSLKALLGVSMAAPDDREEVQRAVQAAGMQPSETGRGAATSAIALSMSGPAQTQVSMGWCGDFLLAAAALPPVS